MSKNKEEEEKKKDVHMYSNITIRESRFSSSCLFLPAVSMCHHLEDINISSNEKLEPCFDTFHTVVWH